MGLVLDGSFNVGVAGDTGVDYSRLVIHTELPIPTETWSENFSDGVGRFSTVIDEGNSVFDYDSVDQNLECSFVREPLIDRRLAILSRTYTEDDVFSFTVEWSPISGSLSAFPHIGFFDSGTGSPVIVLKMTDNRYQVELQ